VNAMARWLVASALGDLDLIVAEPELMIHLDASDRDALEAARIVVARLNHLGWTEDERRLQ
jgi:uncharacterized membrane protein